VKANVDAKCPAAGASDRAKVGECRKCLFDECHTNETDCDALKACIDASACKISA
jgi:hypothetical protein